MGEGQARTGCQDVFANTAAGSQRQQQKHLGSEQGINRELMMAMLFGVDNEGIWPLKSALLEHFIEAFIGV